MTVWVVPTFQTDLWFGCSTGGTKTSRSERYTGAPELRETKERIEKMVAKMNFMLKVVNALKDRTFEGASRRKLVRMSDRVVRKGKLRGYRLYIKRQDSFKMLSE